LPAPFCFLTFYLLRAYNNTFKTPVAFSFEAFDPMRSVQFHFLSSSRSRSLPLGNRHMCFIFVNTHAICNPTQTIEHTYMQRGKSNCKTTFTLHGNDDDDKNRKVWKYTNDCVLRLYVHMSECLCLFCCLALYPDL